MANIKSVDQLLVLILLLAVTVNGMETPVLSLKFREIENVVR